MPAPLMRMSMQPNSARAVRIIASIPSRRRTSAFTDRTRAPVAGSLGGGLRRARRIDIYDHNGGAFLGEPNRDCPVDPATAAPVTIAILSRS